MMKGAISYPLLLSIFMWFVSESSFGQQDETEQHVLVAMRMIGHQVLLAAGDSSSQVLPIEKEGNQYKIGFESAFQFDPERLADAIDKTVEKTRIASGYIVEVKNCGTRTVVYSYEVNDYLDTDQSPCGRRSYERDCYELFITITQAYEMTPLVLDHSKQGTSASYVLIGLQVGLSLLLSGFLLYLYRRKRSNPTRRNDESHVLTLGAYQFDKRNLKLLHKQNQVDLTSKEADLLSLLHSKVNDTLERDVILKEVWGDEGDYIGRTLDVFISKLRKKLEADPTIRIINVRGVGYKLVLG